MIDARREGIERQAMGDRREPVRMRRAPALCVRDRNERRVAQNVQQRAQVAAADYAMQRRDRRHVQAARERQMQRLGMKVNDVEFVGARGHAFELRDVMDERVRNLAVVPQRARAARHERGRSGRIGAREQRHLVAARDERLGQVVDDPLGGAVTRGRHAFVERGNLGNTHGIGSRNRRDIRGLALNVPDVSGA